MPYDVVALGEALIDFTPAGISSAGMLLFEQNAGGAPANVLATVSNMGYKTAFIGKVGDDNQGRFLLRTMQNAGIETKAVLVSPDVYTTLAFVQLDEQGERSFSFSRKPGADTCLKAEELDREVLQSCKIFHFGSLSLTDEPARSATIEAIKIAKAAGALISFDPNYRALLWKDKQSAIDAMLEVLPFCDIVKVSDEELTMLTWESDPQVGAKVILNRMSRSALFCAVTLGADGSAALSKSAYAAVPAQKVKVVDTTGAGDIFWGAMLANYLDSGMPKTLDKKVLESMLQFSNRAAAHCVTKRGGIPAAPTRDMM